MKKLNFKEMDLNIYKNYKLWFIIPAVIIFISLLCGTIYAFNKNIDGFANVGIDFQGGTLLTVEMHGADMNTDNKNKNIDFIEDIITSKGIKISSTQPSGESAIIFRYKNVINNVNYNANDKTEEMSNVNKEIAEAVEAKFKAEYGNVEVTASSSITGATASRKLISTAFLSVSIAIALILLYIIIRFDLFSGLGAVVALLHDVMMMIAFTIIFRVQINSSFVAGVITIVAYSINNTIVIFDRLRENLIPYASGEKKMNPGLIVDKSVKDTLTRSIYTTITTLFTISALAIIGVPAIREFALPILFGLIAGMYSSICIAPSVWGLMTEFKIKKGGLKNGNSGTSIKEGKKKGKSKNDEKAIAVK